MPVLAAIVLTFVASYFILRASNLVLRMLKQSGVEQVSGASYDRIDDEGLHITVDGVPHQALHPVGQEGIEEFYEQIYRWFPDRTYPEVLIVGAGEGADGRAAPGRHRRSVEMDVADMGALLAHLLLGPADRNPGQIGRNQEGRHAFRAGLAGPRHDGE